MKKIYRDKLPGIGTSIFAVMSGLAEEVRAVNLSQGFPDFPIDTHLIALVKKYMQAGKNQYAPMPGVKELRHGIANKIRRLYNVRFDPNEEITVTAGATQALFTAIQAFVFPGDEVIVFEPAYDSYVPSIILAGGMPVYIRLTQPHFAIDWDEVERKITSKTRLIILNTPNNPGGYVFSDDDWYQLSRLIRDKEIIILSDEVYEHIVFDGLSHLSGLAYPQLRKKLLAVFSFGKTFHATGWKTGYAVGDKKLTRLFRKVHQFNVFSVNTPVQYALAEYMEDSSHYLNVAELYEQKRNSFVEGLKDSRWKIVPTHGTYFILLDYSNITDQTEFEFAVKLTKEYKIASIPLSSFYHDAYQQKCLRFCFAKKQETLEKAIRILQKVGE